MLVAKASHVSFEAVGDRRGHPSIVMPPRALLFHDEDGEQWPACSVLVGGKPKPTRASPEFTAAARRYLGQRYDPYPLALALPPRELAAWRAVAEVQRIYYVRRGAIMGGTLFQHPFKGGRRRFFFWGPRAPRPRLYERGDFLRLELPDGCVVNQRGFVVP